MTKLRRLPRRGLEETAALWPPVRPAYRYVRRVARLSKDEAGRPGRAVRRGLRRLLARTRREARSAEESSGAVGHFVQVSASYEPGLFHCCDAADLPRTNNDPERLFGSHRYHERRASGRKVAGPGLVVRGSVRLVSGVLTRLGEVEIAELAPQAMGEWRELRQDLERRRHTRVQGRRSRHNPRACLRKPEEKMPQSRLPS